MKKLKYIVLTLIVASLFFACEDRTELTAPAAPNTGSADFSKFVTIGNSLTAGLQSGALYESGQKYSFGKMIANQVGTAFEQPTISDPGIGGRIDAVTLDPFTTKHLAADAGKPTNLNYSGTYNNLGIPGIVLADLIYTESSPSNFVGNNPFINIVLRGKGTVIQQALAAQPTFMTVWIGNNDILGYATSGGLLPYTPEADFANLYMGLLNNISTAGVKDVVVANIPDVTAIPFFTTVGGQLLQKGIKAVVGTKADSSVALLDLTKNLLTLRASQELAEGKGTDPSKPLSNGVILDEGEIILAKTMVAAYNSAILNAANQFGYKYVDMNSFFNEIAATGLKGMEFDGIHLSTLYVTGGLFSLDGVHPTNQGYAVMANKFIEVINKEYNAEIPYINVSTIPGSINLAN